MVNGCAKDTRILCVGMPTGAVGFSSNILCGTAGARQANCHHDDFSL